MPEAWLPGAIRDPGRQAGYRSGRAPALVDVAHFTVGRDSRRLIRDSGLAAFLFPKVGPPYQFCPCDAITSHACEWNRGGLGWEVERMGWHEGLTADQIHWVGVALRWRHAQWGVPLDHWPTTRGRLPIGSAWRGTADHGGLVHRACDQHTDGWTDQEWTVMVGTVAPTPIASQEDDSMVTKYVNKQGNVAYFYIDDAGRFVQKTWSWPKAGWNTMILDGKNDGVAKLGEKITVEDNLKGDPTAGTLHLFARAKDGQNMAHASYVGRWVIQVD